jgi:hypothetical protein
MLKKIDVTEIGISISSIVRLSLKNISVILFYTSLGFLLAFSFTASPLMDEETYVASGTISHSLNSNPVIQNTIIDAVTSTEFSEFVSLQLEEDGIGLIDGSFLSARTIKNSLTATATIPSSLKINVSFSYPDEILSVLFLNEIIDHSITYSNNTYTTLQNGVTLGEYAVSSVFEGAYTTMYLITGASLGLIIGLIAGVLYHAVRGTIYSVQDPKEFDISALYIQMKSKSKLSFNRFLNLIGFGEQFNFEEDQTKLILQGLVGSSSFTTIQNNLESTRNKPEEPLTTLMVTPMPTPLLTMVAFAYARQSSTQGRKTILIDFDLKDVPFTKYLAKYQIETKKKVSSKEGVTFLSLEENLDLYLPLQDIIPAKVIRDQNTQDIITQVKKKYDHIIILGPSLLPDSSNISILSYVNSALIVLKSSKSTTMELFRSINILIDNQLTAIETLVVEEKIQTTLPSINEIKSWFLLKPKPIVEQPLPPKPSKRK